LPKRVSPRQVETIFVLAEAAKSIKSAVVHPIR